jgi:hypothetical protein
MTAVCSPLDRVAIVLRAHGRRTLEVLPDREERR